MDDNVFTGTGISCPEAMIAFLLLLVKTIGREMTLNSPSGIQRPHDRRQPNRACSGRSSSRRW